MEDKLAKVRAEIERLKHQSVIDSDRQAERGLQSASMASFGKVKACEELLSFIDSVQEEPKECMYSKDNYTDEDRKVLCEGCEEECEFNKKEEPANDSFEAEVKKLWMEINTGHSYSIVDSYNQFYGLCMDIAEWQKEQQNMIEPVSEEPVKESAKIQHVNKTCKENGNSLTQEPASDDLYTVAKEYANNITEKIGYRLQLRRAVCFGANWKEQRLMAKAVDATVHLDAGGYPYIPQIELYDYDKDIPFAKEGDKYKVVLIKED